MNHALSGLLLANSEQAVPTLDCQHLIAQADDVNSGETRIGKAGDAIHHEPGFMLAIENEIINEGTGEAELDIVRLATIPHGDSVLAMGRSRSFDGPPSVPSINSLPIGATQDLTSGYLAPYAAFSGARKFLGLLDVADPSSLLRASIDALSVKSTTELVFDTEIRIEDFKTGGIVNTPFVLRQADSTSMKSFFWIMELETPVNGRSLVLSYLQIVMLEFFSRFDNVPGRIKWPHVSFNTMVFAHPPKARHMMPDCSAGEGYPEALRD